MAVVYLGDLVSVEHPHLELVRSMSRGKINIIDLKVRNGAAAHE